jgi:hypothetical protein
MVADGSIHGRLERRLLAGAKGAICSKIFTQRRKGHKDRKGKREEGKREKVIVSQIIVEQMNLESITIIHVYKPFLPLGVLCIFAPLRDKMRVKLNGSKGYEDE